VIETPTTLVLGAGASVAYGLPLNSELTSKLYRLSSSSEFGHRALITAGFGTAEITGFSEEFRASQALSIDDFLTHRIDYSRIGKAAIAAIIREHESVGGLLQRPSVEDHWYMYLWGRLTDDASFEALNRNRLTVVTFNYDRSLEQYLTYAMGARFKRAPEECSQRLSEGWVRIIHVYGKIVGDYGRKSNTPDEIQASLTDDALANLRVIPEGRNEDPVLSQARDALLRAERICFLGFSFQKLNLDRLAARTSCTDLHYGQTVRRPVWGTAYGLTERQIRQAEQRCGVYASGGLIPPPRSPQRHGFFDLQCLRLLRESLVLESEA